MARASHLILLLVVFASIILEVVALKPQGHHVLPQIINVGDFNIGSDFELPPDPNFQTLAKPNSAAAQRRLQNPSKPNSAAAQRRLQNPSKPNSATAQRRLQNPSKLGSLGPHLDAITGKTSAWLRQTGDDLNQKLTKLAMSSAGESSTLVLVIDASGNATEYLFDCAADWTEQANEDLQTHPVRTVAKASLYVAAFAVIVTPAGAWTPVLNAVGFGAEGVKAGTMAARIHSAIGNVSSRSVFAVLQSARMGGYGGPILDAGVRGLFAAKLVSSFP